ncbi:MAG TPA: prolyl oligopeptidase family serine peptidase, partial [Vicinamibacteria bacterium]|nr:prolyl oligopeptidase family serine peptidase [Vicinamibacteria bacterium]
MSFVPRAFLSALGVLATAAAAAQAVAPPVAKKDPKTVTLHGDTLVDEYHWLRNKGTPEVEAHLRAELAYAEAMMRPTAALQQKLYDEMLGRIQQTDTRVPYLDRGYFYYSRTEEGKQYPIFARRKGSLDAPEEVLIDVNRLAEGKKFMSVGGLAVSPDGQLLAYTTDETGFRQYRLSVKDLRTGTVRPETAERVTALTWSEDGRTLLYGVEHPQTKRSYRILRQVLGVKDPVLVYEEKDERFNTWVWKSRDHRWLFIDAGSHTTSESRFAPADRPAGDWKIVSPREQGHEYDVEPHGDTLWIRTNDEGRNFRLVTAPAADPARASWKEVMAHREDVMLAGHWVFKDFTVVLEREAGFPKLRVTDLASGQSHRIEVPEEAALILPGDNREFEARLLRFTYESPITSPSVYDYDPRTRERTLLKQVAVLGGFDPARYRVEVRHAAAPDGVKVPYWVLFRKDLKLDGTGAAFLNAYGSYGSSSSAAFSSNVFSLVDRGVVYAMAYIRGGGELGKKWHDEGRMLKKKNTFTDFIAVAEDLVASKYA